MEKIIDGTGDFERILGQSFILKEMIDRAAKASLSENLIFISGEVGTGKKMFARAIHAHGLKREHPFITVDCRDFSRMDCEEKMALLFGTDAVLYLENIEKMHVDLQAKFLHSLQTIHFNHTDEDHPTRTSPIFIVASGTNLQAEVDAHHLREDLFYHLQICTLFLPPLRDRKNDVPLLVDHFVKKFAKATNKVVSGVTQEFMDQLQAYQWPANIRELKNLIEKAVLLCPGPVLSSAYLPIDIFAKSMARDKKNSFIFDLATNEKMHIQRVIIYTKGNKSEAARLLQIGIATLYRKVEEYGLKEIITESQS